MPGAAGKFREPHHDVHVADIENNIWHVPPPAEGLRDRVAPAFCRRRCERRQGDFIHPVLRAIIVHFWVGYEHPFRDGNGRIARARFYWCMLRHGYEMAEFLSISGPIDRSAWVRASASDPLNAFWWPSSERSIGTAVVGDGISRPGEEQSSELSLFTS